MTSLQSGVYQWGSDACNAISLISPCNGVHHYPYDNPHLARGSVLCQSLKLMCGCTLLPIQWKLGGVDPRVLGYVCEPTTSHL